jgi:hypothetical protein
VTLSRQSTGGYTYSRKTCAVCGTGFTPTSGAQKTCSKKCAREQTRRRRLGQVGADVRGTCRACGDPCEPLPVSGLLFCGGSCTIRYHLERELAGRA